MPFAPLASVAVMLLAFCPAQIVSVLEEMVQKLVGEAEFLIVAVPAVKSAELT